MNRAVVRMAAGIYCALTASYAFLSASAFTFQEVIRPQMFGAGVFSRWHALLYWPWLALMIFDLRPALRRGGAARAWARAFVGVWICVGIGLAIRPLLPGLTDDRRSLIVGAAALVPLVWAAVIDHLAAGDFLARQRLSADPGLTEALEGRWLVAALGAAAFFVMLSAALAPLAMRGSFEPDLLTLGLTVGMAWNAVDHALIFCAAFLVVAVCARAVRPLAFPMQYAAIAAVLSASVGLVVQRTVCDALGFDGPWTALVAGWCGVAIVASWGALRLRSWQAVDARLHTPVDVFFSPPASTPPPARHLLPLVAIAVAAWGVGALSRLLDWDFLLLKTGVIVLWFATVSRVLRLTPPVRLNDRAVALACVAPLAVHISAGAIERYAPTIVGESTFSVRRVLDRYTIYSPSFRVADSTLRPSLASGGQARFLRFVRENTDLRVEVTPPKVDFVGAMTAAPRPPHIFLFVVDSLRPDYLSPYNPAVTFTPRLAGFAAESLVFRNAFTQYGGTGLSLPAVWMGGVGVHKQYVRPFAPMNTLEKLLNANGYQGLMGVDVIMEQLLEPAASPIELDRGVRTMDYRICRTLDELAAKFPASSGPGQPPPVFGYSLPQDLHVSNIMTASVPPGESYPGFHAPYAARVRAIDRCFGAFVDFLKRRKLYDDSVIVLTADHGEMLGEEGRWGHAYYLFPEILRVPLLMHLPSTVRPDAGLDPDAIVFLTDIAPTLYAALGYRPRPANRLMGEPLIGPDRAASQARRRGDFVAAASYSAVYAVIRRNGHRVYIVDAIKGDEYAYERSPGDVWQRATVTEAARAPAQRLIREHLDEIRQVFRLPETGEPR